MDLEKRGYSELAAAFLNAYLEHTGDYQSLSVLRWYLVYRALVRAKVSVMRSRQEHEVQRLSVSQIEPAMEYIRLGKRMITPERTRTLDHAWSEWQWQDDWEPAGGRIRGCNSHSLGRGKKAAL